MNIQVGKDIIDFKNYLETCQYSEYTKEKYLQILKRYYKMFDTITNDNLNIFFLI